MSTLRNWAGMENIAITDSAMHVANVGVSGSVNIYTVTAAAAAGSGDGTNEYISSATGWKTVKVVQVNPVAALVTADQLLMVGFSGTESDQAAVTVILDAVRTALATPDSTGRPNVVVTNTAYDPITLTWDGTTTIKTVSVASQGTTSYDLALICVS